MDDVAALVAAARSLDAAVVAIELQWELEEDDEGTLWVLLVCAIIEKPGASHSRYRAHTLCTLPAEERDQRVRARDVGAAVAAALGVVAHVPPVEQRGGGAGSRWIEAQGVGSPVLYEVRWDAYTWTDDGERVEESGAVDTAAISGTVACRQVEDQVRERLGAAVRPTFVRTAIAGMHQGYWSSHLPPLAADLPGVDALRAWHLDGRSIGAIVDALRAQTPAPTALAIMRALEQAFGVTLDELAVVAARCAERLSAAQLDDALDGVIVDRRARWDRPRRLRAARAAGASLTALLHAERSAGAHSIELMQSLMEAFGISLRDAKGAIGGLGAGRDDAVDAELTVAIAANGR